MLKNWLLIKKIQQAIIIRDLWIMLEIIVGRNFKNICSEYIIITYILLMTLTPAKKNDIWKKWSSCFVGPMIPVTKILVWAFLGVKHTYVLFLINYTESKIITYDEHLLHIIYLITSKSFLSLEWKYNFLLLIVAVGQI